MLTSALNVKVIGIQTNVGESSLRARRSDGNSNKGRARQLCFLGGRAPECGEIIGVLKKLKHGMSAALAGSQNADEEDCKTDHAPRVAAMENEEVATLTATIETNLRQGDLVTGVDSLSEIHTSVASSEIWFREDLGSARGWRSAASAG